LHKSEKGEAFAKENPDVISNAAAQMLRPYNQKLTFARGLLSGSRVHSRDIFVIE
jgi:hypothetical protein